MIFVSYNLNVIAQFLTILQLDDKTPHDVSFSYQTGYKQQSLQPSDQDHGYQDPVYNQHGSPKQVFHHHVYHSPSYHHHIYHHHSYQNHGYQNHVYHHHGYHQYGNHPQQTDTYSYQDHGTVNHQRPPTQYQTVYIQHHNHGYQQPYLATSHRHPTAHHHSPGVHHVSSYNLQPNQHMGPLYVYQHQLHQQNNVPIRGYQLIHSSYFGKGGCVFDWEISRMCINFNVVKCWKPIQLLYPMYTHIARWRYLKASMSVSELKLIRKKRKMVKKFKDTKEYVYLKPHYDPTLCSVNIEVQPSDCRHEIISRENNLVSALTAKDKAEEDSSTSTFYYAFLHTPGSICALSTSYTQEQVYQFSTDVISKIIYMKIAAAAVQRRRLGATSVVRREPPVYPVGSWKTEKKKEIETYSVVTYLETERYYKEQREVYSKPRIQSENEGLYGLKRHETLSFTRRVIAYPHSSRKLLVIEHMKQSTILLNPNVSKNTLLLRLYTNNPQTSTLVIIGHSHYLITDLYGFTFREFSNRISLGQRPYRRIGIEKHCQGSKLKMVPYSYFTETEHQHSFLDHDPQCETIYTSREVPNTFYPYNWFHLTLSKPPGSLLFVIRVHFMRVPSQVVVDKPIVIEIDALFEV